ncbi:MAG: hypothetical protein ACKO8I_02230 [Cyanobacteriota bacterium]
MGRSALASAGDDRISQQRCAIADGRELRRHRLGFGGILLISQILANVGSCFVVSRHGARTHRWVDFGISSALNHDFISRLDFVYLSKVKYGIDFIARWQIVSLSLFFIHAWLAAVRGRTHCELPPAEPLAAA